MRKITLRKILIKKKSNYEELELKTDLFFSKSPIYCLFNKPIEVSIAVTLKKLEIIQKFRCFFHGLNQEYALRSLASCD